MLAVVLSAIGAGTADAAASRKKRHHTYRQPVDRYASVVIEASTGYVLSEKNADKELYPASLTKMMTLYLAFEALSNGRVQKNQRLPVSRRAAAQEPSSLGLAPGENIRLEDAILAIVTKSANDCAVVLAEGVGGSEDRFARAMTAKARQLGMMNSRFVNASGLFHRGQVSTARDMSILAQALIRDYPAYYRYFSVASFSYDGNVYNNHNKLMSSYRGMDGLKTGYVYASGYNLAASAVQNGTRLIGVVFGGRTAKSRNAEMASLLNKGFARLSNVRVATLAEEQKRSKRKSVPARPVSEDKTPAIPVMEPDADRSVRQGIDQGDTNTGDDKAKVRKYSGVFRPHTLNTASLAGDGTLFHESRSKDWAVQIGAFTTPAAGIQAMAEAQRALSGKMEGVNTIAPLMTNRGVVYRARLSGLDKGDATQACRILRGSCLVLAVK